MSDPKPDWRASDVLDGAPLGSAEEERLRAKAWMDTAAQNERNTDYYRNARDRLYREALRTSPELRERWKLEAYRLGALGDVGGMNPPTLEQALQALLDGPGEPPDNVVPLKPHLG
jgi:hypothetical protein